MKNDITHRVGERVIENKGAWTWNYASIRVKAGVHRVSWVHY